jgi:hypothetical protein
VERFSENPKYSARQFQTSAPFMSSFDPAMGMPRRSSDTESRRRGGFYPLTGSRASRGFFAEMGAIPRPASPAFVFAKRYIPRPKGKAR